MDLGLLEDRLKTASKKNRLPKVVAPVHFAGNPVDMEFLDRLRRRYGFKVVEDAAHATGAELRGEKVGSCRWSDLCVFSFHAVKIITTGEGGMITTNSKKVYKKILQLRSHGISRSKEHRPLAKKWAWYYEKLDLGMHYRMTDMQAALGNSQLAKINSFRRKRVKIVKDYLNEISDLPIDLPKTTKGALSSWHLFSICTKGTESQRNQVLKRLKEKNIQGNVHYLPVLNFSFYKNKKKMPCPRAEDYAKKAISLPIFPALKLKEILKCSQILRKVLDH